MSLRGGKRSGLWLLLVLLGATAGTPSAALEDGLSLVQVQVPSEASADDTTGLWSAAAQAIYNASQDRLMQRAQAFSQQQAVSFNQKLEELALAKNVSDQERGLLLVQHATRLVDGDEAASEALVQLRAASIRGGGYCFPRALEAIGSFVTFVSNGALSVQCDPVKAPAQCAGRYYMLFEYIFLAARDGLRAATECMPNLDRSPAQKIEDTCRAHSFGSVSGVLAVAARASRMSYTCQRDFTFKKLDIPRETECVIFSTTLVGAFVVNLIDIGLLVRAEGAQKLMRITNPDAFWKLRFLKFMLQLSQFSLMLVSTCGGKGGWGTACGLESVRLAQKAAFTYSALDAASDWCYDSYGTNFFREQRLIQHHFTGAKRGKFKTQFTTQRNIDRLQKLLDDQEYKLSGFEYIMSWVLWPWDPQQEQEPARREMERRILRLKAHRNVDLHELDQLEKILEKDGEGAAKKKIKQEKDKLQLEMEKTTLQIEENLVQENIDQLEREWKGEEDERKKEEIERQLKQLDEEIAWIQEKINKKEFRLSIFIANRKLEEIREEVEEIQQEIDQLKEDEGATEELERKINQLRQARGAREEIEQEIDWLQKERIDHLWEILPDEEDARAKEEIEQEVYQLQEENKIHFKHLISLQKDLQKEGEAEEEIQQKIDQLVKDRIDHLWKFLPEEKIQEEIYQLQKDRIDHLRKILKQEEDEETKKEINLEIDQYEKEMKVVEYDRRRKSLQAEEVEGAMKDEIEQEIDQLRKKIEGIKQDLEVIYIQQKINMHQKKLRNEEDGEERDKIKQEIHKLEKEKIQVEDTIQLEP